MSIRDDIRALCAEHDRFMAEQASESMRRPPVSETEADAGLVYKTYDNAALPAPQPEPQPSSDEPNLAYAVREFAAATSRRFDRLEHAHAELRGQVSALLTLLGQRVEPDASKSGAVVELPNWRRRGVA